MATTNNTLDELMDKARAAYSDAAAPGGAWKRFVDDGREELLWHLPELWKSLGVTGEVAFFDHSHHIVYFKSSWPDLYVRWNEDDIALYDEKRLGTKEMVIFQYGRFAIQPEADDIGLFLLDAHLLRGGTWE